MKHRKFLHNLTAVVVITLCGTYAHGMHQQVAQNDEGRVWPTLQNVAKISSPVLGGIGAGVLSKRLAEGQSWQNLGLPATFLLASPLAMSYVQSQYRKQYDPEHKGLLSKWWLPALGTFLATAGCSAYQNNLLQGALYGAALSLPAAGLAWKWARDERKNREEEGSSSGAAGGVAQGGLSSKTIDSMTLQEVEAELDKLYEKRTKLEADHPNPWKLAPVVAAGYTAAHDEIGNQITALNKAWYDKQAQSLSGKNLQENLTLFGQLTEKLNNEIAELVKTDPNRKSPKMQRLEKLRAIYGAHADRLNMR